MKNLKLLLYRFYSSFAFRILIGAYVIAIVAGVRIYILEREQEPLVVANIVVASPSPMTTVEPTTIPTPTPILTPTPTPIPAPSLIPKPKPVVPTNNFLPGSGYTRQKVSTSRGEFVISMVIAPGARVVIETAGDSDCSDNCPTKSLAEHVAASGGFAGINGSYFCPPDYPKCQGKVNTFDTLAVNGRTKAVLNRANNVYSTVPLVAAYGSRLSFYDQTVQWGADTSSGGGLANYPRLLRDGAVATTEENGKGTRGFIASREDTTVIGHVYSASFADTAEVLKTLGLQNAMNLDGGGSTALWYGGYKAGPGRSLPTAIVLVK
jgi:hypothetical protein